MVYHHKISNTDRLKHVLIDCLTQLCQDTFNRVINQSPKSLLMVPILNFVWKNSVCR